MIPDEPLESSAPLAWQWAALHCAADAEAGESCAWNHGLWQFLRMMGLAGTAAHRGEFYQPAIREFAAANPAPRLLISGTTDYALLAQAITALRGTVGAASFTVLDICETPLRLSRWYAERTGLSIRTVRSDMLHYEPDEQFDLICTDSFLGRFEHAQWPRLAAKWHTLLRPRGQLLTASRLRPPSASNRVRFDADQIVAFRNAVHARAQALDLGPGVSPEDLAAMAERYGRHQTNYPLHSTAQLQSLLQDAGFDIASLTFTSRTVGNSDGIRAPSVPSNARFACVVAARR